VWLVADNHTPDPNQEVTVYVRTDGPLYLLSLWAQAVGDANVTAVMGPADCNQYGWEPGWNIDGYYDSDGWVALGGVAWPNEANGVVGYLRFTYHGGQVAVSIAGEWSIGFDAECQPAVFFADPILIGEPDPNQMMQGGGQDRSIPEIERAEQITAESFKLPPLAPPARNKPRPGLLYCPSDAGVAKAQVKSPLEAESNVGEALAGEGGESLMELDLPIVEINSDITTNQIWTPDNIYHITASVNVQALLVIEPGTLMSFGYYGGLIVNNGGTLISSGTPDAPIIYTSDVRHGWGDYFCAILVEPTASPATRITYNYIECAYVAIWTRDIRLDTPIENNRLSYNRYGVVEYGTRHSDIVNNRIADCYNPYGSCGIEVYMESLEGQGEADSYILIQNNTCDYHHYGIFVHGTDQEQAAGTVAIVNNIVSWSAECGLSLVDGYMQGMVANTGYYYNAANKNWAFGEYDPVQATQDPYDPQGWHLVEDCPFIDAGMEYIEQTRLIGTTTSTDGLPDGGFTDIGFHYPNWDYVNAGTGLASGDLNKDTITDGLDLDVLADTWLDTGTPGIPGDLNSDGEVDFKDFALLAATWQVVEGHPDIIPIISDGPGPGYTDIGVAGITSDTERAFLLVDGVYVGEILGFRSEDSIPLDISALGSGAHELKTVAISIGGQVTCSRVASDNSSCFLARCVGATAYEVDEPYHFCADYSGESDISVSVYDRDDNLVWSQTYLGQNLNDSVPASVTASNNLDSIVFAEASPSGESLTKPLAVKFNPKKVPANIKALIISPNWWRRKFSDHGNFTVVEQAFQARGVPYAYLTDKQASYEVLKWYGQNRTIEYIYYSYHGGYQPVENSSLLRTTIQLSDGYVFSVKQSDFPSGQAPPWCEVLPGSLEATAHSMRAIGFPEGRLKFVHFDCCFTGRLKLTGNGTLIEGPEGQQGLLATSHNDMSWALGMCSSATQVYQGWWNEAIKGETSRYNIWTFNEWDKLKDGDTLWNAITYTINQTKWVPSGPHDNYRLMGQGDLTALRIQ